MGTIVVDAAISLSQKVTRTQLTKMRCAIDAPNLSNDLVRLIPQQVIVLGNVNFAIIQYDSLIGDYLELSWTSGPLIKVRQLFVIDSPVLGLTLKNTATGAATDENTLTCKAITVLTN